MGCAFPRDACKSFIAQETRCRLWASEKISSELAPQRLRKKETLARIKKIKVYLTVRRFSISMLYFQIADRDLPISVGLLIYLKRWVLSWDAY
jgi:hypothetical protein